MSVSTAFTISLYKIWQGISSLHIILASEAVFQQSRRCFLTLWCQWILISLFFCIVQATGTIWDCFWMQSSLRGTPQCSPPFNSEPLVSPPSGLGFCYQRTPCIGKVANIAHFWELNFWKEKIVVPCVTDLLHLNSQGRCYLEIGGEQMAHSFVTWDSTYPLKVFNAQSL